MWVVKHGILSIMTINLTIISGGTVRFNSSANYVFWPKPGESGKTLLQVGATQVFELSGTPAQVQASIDAQLLGSFGPPAPCKMLIPVHESILLSVLTTFFAAGANLPAGWQLSSATTITGTKVAIFVINSSFLVDGLIDSRDVGDVQRAINTLRP